MRKNHLGLAQLVEVDVDRRAARPFTNPVRGCMFLSRRAFIETTQDWSRVQFAIPDTWSDLVNDSCDGEIELQFCTPTTCRRHRPKITYLPEASRAWQ